MLGVEDLSISFGGLDALSGLGLETGRLVASGPSAGLAEDPRVRTAYLGLDGRTP